MSDRKEDRKGSCLSFLISSLQKRKFMLSLNLKKMYWKKRLGLEKKVYWDTMSDNTKILMGVGAALAIGATAYIIYRRRQAAARNESAPPHNAPQLDVDNPGSQDEFLTAPSTSALG